MAGQNPILNDIGCVCFSFKKNRFWVKRI